MIPAQISSRLTRDSTPTHTVSRSPETPLAQENTDSDLQPFIVPLKIYRRLLKLWGQVSLLYSSRLCTEIYLTDLDVPEVITCRAVGTLSYPSLPYTK